MIDDINDDIEIDLIKEPTLLVADDNHADITALRALCNGKNRLLGFDIGEKTLGLALSDNRWKIATPLITLPRTQLSKDVIKLQQFVEEHKIAAFICGLPVNMNGSHGPRVQATRDYMKALTIFCPLPVIYWDERLTTMMAERTLIKADMSRKRRKDVIDKMAAALILQGFLDRLSYL